MPESFARHGMTAWKRFWLDLGRSTGPRPRAARTRLSACCRRSWLSCPFTSGCPPYRRGLASYAPSAVAGTPRESFTVAPVVARLREGTNLVAASSSLHECATGSRNLIGISAGRGLEIHQNAYWCGLLAQRWYCGTSLLTRTRGVRLYSNAYWQIRDLKPDEGSGGFRTPIPIESVHRFRSFRTPRPEAHVALS